MRGRSDVKFAKQLVKSSDLDSLFRAAILRRGTTFFTTNICGSRVAVHGKTHCTWFWNIWNHDLGIWSNRLAASNNFIFCLFPTCTWIWFWILLHPTHAQTKHTFCIKRALDNVLMPIAGNCQALQFPSSSHCHMASNWWSLPFVRTWIIVSRNCRYRKGKKSPMAHIDGNFQTLITCCKWRPKCRVQQCSTCTPRTLLPNFVGLKTLGCPQMVQLYRSVVDVFFFVL